MSDQRWKDVDPAELQRRARQQKEDATMSGNAGAYPVPIGGVLRPPNIVGGKKKKTKG